MASPLMEPAHRLLERIFRHESGQVLASLIGLLGDFDQAEDALQDAIVAALEHWPREGVPANPGGWLMTTARRKALDRLRRQRAGEEKQLAAQELADRLGHDEMPDPAHPIADDRLKLLFTCCHPALNLDARVALTLRTLGGLSTAEIAHAFLVPVPTMAQRLTRAKQKIRAAQIPYRVPPLELLPERVPGLLAVLYLIFNAGYSTTEGQELMRRDLCIEAIRLTRELVAFLGREFGIMPESLGLLALMLAHDSRRDARVSPEGDLVLLEDQDRACWDQDEIAESVQLVQRTLCLRHPGPYQIQAAIAAVHAQASSSGATDWPQIAFLYGVLARMTPSPVVELNRAVAVAMADGPPHGLALLDMPALADALRHYHLYHAARADLLRRLGRHEEAHDAYVHALDLCQNAVERAFLTKRLQEVG